MEGDPGHDWHALSEHYRQFYDQELLDLAEQKQGLTETARQVLDGELTRRGLEKPKKPGGAAIGSYRARLPLDEEPVAREDGSGEDAPLGEMTWKTVLCQCDDAEQAWQLRELLRRAGIESWAERPGGAWSTGLPRVLVAADQLDEARAIAAQPVPQEIIDLSKMDDPEYQPPVCPACGAEDPVLESADPSNTWLCEACGKEWTEAAEDPGQ